MGFTQHLQDHIADIFVNVVAETQQQTASILREKLALLKDRSDDEAFSGLAVKVANLRPEEALLVAEMDAKLVDVQWRARKMAGVAVLNAVSHCHQVRTGDTFHELMERFCRKNLSSSVVQSLLKYAYVWPSLTTHPTNPTSFAYTTAGLRLDRLLSEQNATVSRLVMALRDIRDTSMEFDVDPTTRQPLLKKTPALEISELISILNVIYDSVVGPQVRLREALDRFGYGDVVFNTPLLDLNLWGAGDGDGNPNMDFQWLEHQVVELRKAIRSRYVADLQHVSLDLSGEVYAEFISQKEMIVARLIGDRYQRDEDLVADLRGFRAVFVDHAQTEDNVKHRVVTHLNELLIKCCTFGLRFARTDVRHNSVDIMAAAGALLSHLQVIPSPAAFDELPEPQQILLMRSAMNNATFLHATTSLSADDIKKSFGEVGSRVFLRMRVIAANPDMFQKLIIAETRSAANAVAVLMMLKFSGNKVAEAGARISVVPLFESREDLQAAPNTFHTLATDETFNEHLRATGMFVAMIAKSDTTRLSGPGVQGQQEETVAKLMSVNTTSYGHDFAMNIFLGGGDDQMRGGGRIVETPHVLTLAASRFGATRPSRFAMTVQGLQMQLVFGSRVLSEHFIEAFASQQLLAAARLLGFVRYRPTPLICNRKSADQSAHDFFNASMDCYELMVGSPDQPGSAGARRATIVDYYSHFPTAIIAMSNKSSRPGARKKTSDPLQGRAISLDQLSKHDGAYVTATLGVTRALSQLHGAIRTGAPEHAGNPLSPLRHAYLANKSFRDFVRMQAVVLFQKDFSVSWALRGGRPSSTDFEALARAGAEAVAHGTAAKPREFLAFIESQDLEEVRYLIIAITGEDRRPISTRDPLTVGWFDLADKMVARERQAKLSQHMLLRAIKAMSDPQNTLAQRAAYFGYVAVNPKFSTPSFSLTMTDPQKEGSEKLSETSPAVSARLSLPLWARVSKI
ncbi:phosphoenolpyruvate carboxylase, putative [Bodo saltans]|uniref:Phosphoenolpyruvate carboxylase, putative n=1 Tax=Bodo saltans TaxID=75058 RepID=A0A0S4IRL7_BODSA|nr:phosphoenolpyruvate carboxylase, putative [Bodo saltans]|eukprot:CUF39763.1 phosphoenolpyruvate carboxylase, putative [Bodo saltans]